jgi:flagellar P-ring protein precursor FlgI
VQGVRSNQLTGYGLVVGLDGTGDQTTQAPFTAQSLGQLLQQMGITPAAGRAVAAKNVAAVMVTATCRLCAAGAAIDVNVSSLGNAKSLRGGTLIATPLRGADGEIYAMAQGNLIVGGAGASAGGSKVQINHLSAGRVPEGATVERSVPTPLNAGRHHAARPEQRRLRHRARGGQAINKAKGAKGTARAGRPRGARCAPPQPRRPRGLPRRPGNLPLCPGAARGQWCSTRAPARW